MALAVFDIGGTSVKFGLWKEDALSCQGSFPTPSSWQEMKDQLQRQVRIYQATETVTGAAFSAPGAVDSKTGIIGGVSAVPYIHHLPFKQELSELFGVPVTVENDANCAALGEVWRGAAEEVRNAAFIVIGTGIGGAVIIDRQLVKGRDLFGGEFGYMFLDGEHTFSYLASPVQAAKRYQREGKLEETIDGKELFHRADTGEERAQRYVTELIHYLALGIHNLLVSFNPDKVIIGGGLSARESLIAELREEVGRLLVKSHGTDVTVDIQPCRYRNDANLIGAVAHFIQEK